MNTKAPNILQKNMIGREDYFANLTPGSKRVVEKGGVFGFEVPQDVISNVTIEITKRHGKALARAFFDKEVRTKLDEAISRIVTEQRILIDKINPRDLTKLLSDEIIGTGPLEEIINDPKVTEIMINGPHEIYIEREGREEKTKIKFRDDEQLQKVLRKMLNFAGQTINTQIPDVNARLPGLRLNVVFPPVSRNGTSATIRKYNLVALDEKEMVAKGLLTQEILKTLEFLVRGCANILVIGATGSGKTTTMRALCRYISERTITIEDNEELMLKTLYPGKHIVPMECRLTLDKITNIDMDRLLRNALRQRPKRIIVGEVRGKEALTMIKAYNTGHDGGMTSIHANNVEDAMDRIVQMVMESGIELSETTVVKMAVKAFDIIITQEQLPDGSRKITEIAEVVGYRDGEVLLNYLYRFDFQDIQDGNIIGEHVKSETFGLSKDLIKKLIRNGVSRDDINKMLTPKEGVA